MPGTANTEAIEYVGRCWEVEGRRVLTLCSMKLHHAGSESPINDVKNIHRLVAALIEANQISLKNQEYYAVVYCCWPADQILAEAKTNPIPPGTVVVPVDSLNEVMYPFGASCLLNQGS